MCIPKTYVVKLKSSKGFTSAIFTCRLLSLSCRLWMTPECLCITLRTCASLPSLEAERLRFRHRAYLASAKTGRHAAQG